MKHQGAFLCGFCAVVTLAHGCAGGVPFSCGFWLARWFLVLAWMPDATTRFWPGGVGIFNRFWFWTVVYARGFAQQVPFRTGMKLFWQFRDIATANWLLPIAALLGALAPRLGETAAAFAGSVLAYFAFSFSRASFGLMTVRTIPSCPL